MGNTYTRQSTYTDGDTIQAADSNDEFDQLVLAFTADSGHSHDGTAGEGGDVTKLLGAAITIGDGSAGADIVVTFDGETTDGVLTWKEDEDHFLFGDDVVIDAVRCAKLALDRSISGPLREASAYFMKSPPVQYTDDEARRMVEDFILGA